MSDGHTDAALWVETRFEDYVDFLVDYYESSGDELAPKEESANILDELKEIAADLKAYSSEALVKYLGLPESVVAGLFEAMAKDEIPNPECLMLFLFAQGEFAKIIRLQKSTRLSDSLLVFADCRGRVCDNGVFYTSRMKFMDGDQDIVLGYAKKRFHKDFPLEQGIYLNAKPYLVVADWNMYRKRWMVRSIHFS